MVHTNKVNSHKAANYFINKNELMGGGSFNILQILTRKNKREIWGGWGLGLI